MIRLIHTLGPYGTNCNAAAHYYIKHRQLSATVRLHPTLEQAIDLVIGEPNSALLGCVVYPNLHNLVFPYLGRMRLKECFMFDTFNMVLASRRGSGDIRTVATHIAPKSLVATDLEAKIVNSNAQAALDCKNGDVDACITTLKSAQDNDLEVLKDHGAVPMGFSIHVPVAAT